MSELMVLINGEPVGKVVQGRGGQLSFTYDRAWMEGDDCFPLSLSMPLGQEAHDDLVVRPFMEGLLPDNFTTLRNWARRFGVSANNPFALLSNMGEDCAGAVQFVRRERFEEVASAERGGVEWLTEEDVAERLRDLVERQGTGRLAGDHGQFSLAGAQPKVPLHYDYDGRRWGIPFGHVPTTHILKPPVQADLEGLEVNEHLCLRIARELGLATAGSSVLNLEDQQALVVERYDRRRLDDGHWIRLHQEDVAQSLSVPPDRKYENEGGPGAPEVVSLLVRESDDPDRDVGAFIDTLALNWVIGGTDAHAKNYSLLIGPGSVRLAPLYDLISILPYPRRIAYERAKLAMRIDREYALRRIRRRHWAGLAERCQLDPEPLLERVGELVATVPEAVERAAASVRAEGIREEIVDRMVDEIHRHSEGCTRVMDAGG